MHKLELVLLALKNSSLQSLLCLYSFAIRQRCRHNSPAVQPPHTRCSLVKPAARVGEVSHAQEPAAWPAGSARSRPRRPGGPSCAPAGRACRQTRRATSARPRPAARTRPAAAAAWACSRAAPPGAARSAHPPQPLASGYRGTAQASQHSAAQGTPKIHQGVSPCLLLVYSSSSSGGGGGGVRECSCRDLTWPYRLVAATSCATVGPAAASSRCATSTRSATAAAMSGVQPASYRAGSCMHIPGKVKCSWDSVDDRPLPHSWGCLSTSIQSARQVCKRSLPTGASRANVSGWRHLPVEAAAAVVRQQQVHGGDVAPQRRYV